MYKKNFYYSIGIVVILLVSVAIFNLMLDPSNLFSNKTIIYAVNEMVKGHNIKGLKNWDEMALKKLFIKSAENKPKVVVLGSSRSMEINSKLLGVPLHNYSVSGGRMEKLISLWWVSRKDNPGIQKYIICVDDWTFVDKPKEPYVNDEDFDNAYSFLMGKGNNRSYSLGLSKYGQLVSWEYFLASKRLWRDTRDSGLKVEATEAWISETPILRYDGSRHNGTKINSVSAKELDQKVKKHITSSLPNWLGRKEKINDSRRQLFERWIDCMISENKQIVFWLPPYHPSVYNAILESDDYKIVLDSERYLREYAASKGIKVLGSYNPSLLGITQNDFFDGMHMKEGSMDNLLKGKL